MFILRKAIIVFLAFLLIVAALACDKKDDLRLEPVIDKNKTAERKSPSVEDLRILSSPDLKPVLEKVIERVKSDPRLPKIFVDYKDDEMHPALLSKKSGDYDLMLSIGKENWKFAVEKGFAHSADGVSLATNQILLAIKKRKDLPGNPLDYIKKHQPENIALADPEKRIAGVHAQEALLRVGLWHRNEEKKQGKPFKNRRAAMNALVAGEAEFAAVYRSDLFADERLGMIFMLPKASHFSIVYYGIPLSGTAKRDAVRLFLLELYGPESAIFWKKSGFLPPPVDGP